MKKNTLDALTESISNSEKIKNNHQQYSGGREKRN